MTPSACPAVIVISSHVVRGAIGNRAAVFALETLGFPVWAVPTVVLPWHPGHGAGTKIVPPKEAFAALLHDLERASWLGEVRAVLSGYMGDEAQPKAVAGLVRAVKAINPAALYVCDPVIGDTGGLYVPEATARAVRDELMPLADIATPNRAELSWLTGMPANTIDDAVEAARNAGPACMLVTSAPVAPPQTGSLLVTAERILLAEHATVPNPPNGLGDLTGALFLGHRLAGGAPETSLKATTASVLEILSQAVSRGSDELMLAADAKRLAAPSAHVTVRDLHG